MHISAVVVEHREHLAAADSTVVLVAAARNMVLVAVDTGVAVVDIAVDKGLKARMVVDRNWMAAQRAVDTYFFSPFAMLLYMYSSINFNECRCME